MNQSNFLNRARREGGFTLLEALVALLVLSIGLLGIAGLMVQGLRYNQDAYTRTHATMLAYDLFERIRINNVPANVLAYGGVAPVQPPACGDAGLALAVDDRLCWHTAVAALLPGGTANVGIVGAVPGPFTITVTINWVDRNSGRLVAQIWTVII